MFLFLRFFCIEHLQVQMNIGICASKSSRYYVLSDLETKLMDIIKARMKKYYTMVNRIFYMELMSDDENNTTKIMEKLNTLKIKIGLQSFTKIDEPIIFNVCINENTFVARDYTVVALNKNDEIFDDDNPKK